MQYSRGSKFIVTVRPKLALTSIFSSGTTNNAFHASDVLFDWTGFHFPKFPFAAKLIGITTMVQGDDLTLTQEPMNLFFAQPNPDGTAPPSLGAPDAAISTAKGGYYRNMLGIAEIVINDGNDLIINQSFSQTVSHYTDDKETLPIILGSEKLTTENANNGNLYIAGQCIATPSFGSALLVNNSNQAATTAATNITVDSDVTKLFSIGDTVHAHDGAEVGIVTGFGDAAGSNQATILQFAGGIKEAIEDDDELVNLQPITIRLMFEA
tara:strand:- start:1769 stop:2569 length:801 start_codon:yes stop_codon:yes gene_type:complete